MNRAIGMRRMIDAFKAVGPAVPLSYLDVFIAVAMRPDGKAEEFKEDTSIMLPALYRILKELSDASRHPGREGLELIAEIPADGRTKLWRLTPKGEAVWQQMLQAVEIIKEPSQGRA